MDFFELLNKERLFFDGSMGTMLQGRGLPVGELPEVWNITNPDVVADIHRAYADAGCHVLKTNTFGANRLKLAETGHSVELAVTAAVAAATAGGAWGGGRLKPPASPRVALSVGPIGKLLAPLGDLDFGAAIDIFAETIDAGARAGADIVLIETMGDAYEIKAAMLAAKETCNLPVIVTFTVDESGRLLTGGDIAAAVCLIEGLGAGALGLNCGLGAAQMKALLPKIAELTSIPVIINPNAGIPELINGKTVFNVTPDEFAVHMAEIAPFAQGLGGCCGTTPAHISKMMEVCGGLPFNPAVYKEYTAVSSYSKAVFFGESTVIIGERINPTGKPRMKRALKENDMGYLFREGLLQVENGADILDVNVGIPGVDEPAVLTAAVCGLQSVCDAPLQIDTSDVVAAERALRRYNGKPLLNSVNGKKESLDAVLPLVKKYGAAVVALTLDENGIPETAQGRVEIAEKIIAAAAGYGIPKKDIIVDALTMTVSTGADNAKITLDAVARIRGELGVHTVLGVSNVSFGLPEREKVNAAFFTLAMSKGLSAGIINPMNSEMTDAFFTYRALNGLDENLAGYVGRFNTSVGTPYMVSAPTLQTAVIRGLKTDAAKLAKDALKDTPPLEIINGQLIPALDAVGQDFERKKIYLPQLLMSAEAAKAAFEVIKESSKDVNRGKHGKHGKNTKIVLATVKGDIHDIGKNIVKILLENYNFEVIDLGKNVEPSAVVEAVVNRRGEYHSPETNIIVGLSALMTTTVPAMEETIRLVKQAAPEVPVMVGGAVLTEEYAKKIGADFYAKDAMAGVRFALGQATDNR